MKYRLKQGLSRFIVNYNYRPYLFDDTYFREYPDELIEKYKDSLEPEVEEKVKQEKPKVEKVAEEPVKEEIKPVVSKPKTTKPKPKAKK
jgi:hypothetical protein